MHASDKDHLEAERPERVGRVERATRIVNKWGAPVVAFSFLTIGFQTACNAAAGLTGMPLKRYLPALAAGGFAWAIIYASVGLAAIGLWLQLFFRSPWAAVVALALVVALVIQLVRHKRRSGGLAPTGTGDEVDAPVRAEVNGPVQAEADGPAQPRAESAVGSTPSSAPTASSGS